MWKKDETPEPTRVPSPEVVPVTAAAPRRPEAPNVATIGRSIRIKGEVTGDEDLVIQGRVEGSVNLKQHAITVGPDGDVRASIVGRVVTIEGTVEGDLTAEEQVVLRSSAFVQGNVVAPRVVLEGGARFRGSVDMGEEPHTKVSGSGAAAAPKKTKVEVPAERVEAFSGNGKGSKEDATAKLSL